MANVRQGKRAHDHRKYREATEKQGELHGSSQSRHRNIPLVLKAQVAA
jgi:hypothetical protein